MMILIGLAEWVSRIDLLTLLSEGASQNEIFIYKEEQGKYQ
jgi:hypothetical protein